jgi:DnaJ-class molecular chaperone
MIEVFDCPFCSGTGKDPFDLLSSISHCLACNGLGRVNVEKPLMKCVFCAGSGKNPLGARVPCIVCSGKGSNHVAGSNVCLKCKGTGKSGDNLPCTQCKGKGFGA